MRPFRFVISETDEFLVSASGIVLAGALLETTAFRSRLASLRLGHKRRLGVSHADVVFSMLGLLVKGKSDFEDIRERRHDDFFLRALSLAKVVWSKNSSGLSVVVVPLRRLRVDPARVSRGNLVPAKARVPHKSESGRSRGNNPPQRRAIAPARPKLPRPSDPSPASLRPWETRLDDPTAPRSS